MTGMGGKRSLIDWYDCLAKSFGKPVCAKESLPVGDIGGNMNRVGKLLAASAAYAVMVCTATPAFGQKTTEFGPEQTFYVNCSWSSGDERATTQLEEVKWRDTIEVHEDGRQFITRHIGFYIVSLKDALKTRLGTGVACDQANSPTYPSAAPGTTFTSSGRVISAILHKVDADWFLVDWLSKNVTIVSLGSNKVKSKRSNAKQQIAVPASDVPPPSEAKPKYVEVKA